MTVEPILNFILTIFTQLVRFVLAVLFLFIRQPAVFLISVFANFFILILSSKSKCFNPFYGPQYWWRIRIWEERASDEDKPSIGHYYKNAVDVFLNRIHLEPADDE